MTHYTQIYIGVYIYRHATASVHMRVVDALHTHIRTAYTHDTLHTNIHT